MIATCEGRDCQIDKGRNGFHGSAVIVGWIRIFESPKPARVTIPLTIMYVRSAAFIVIRESEEEGDELVTPARLIILLDVKALCETKPLTRLGMRKPRRAPSAVRETLDFMMATDCLMM
jgi:hypothetical protein